VFKFGIGRESHAVMITERMYNTNNWTGVQAKRRGRQGNLIAEAVPYVVIIVSVLIGKRQRLHVIFITIFVIIIIIMCY